MRQKTGSGWRHSEAQVRFWSLRFNRGVLLLGLVVTYVSCVLSGIEILVPSVRAEEVQAAVNLQSDRGRFIAARDALETKDAVGYAMSSLGLDSYVLAPYLDYLFMRHNISAVTEVEINAFSERYPGDYLIPRVRAMWSNELLRRREWGSYLKFGYRSSAVKHRCSEAKALYSTDQMTKADALGLRLWRVGRSQPAECDAVFDKLSERGKITPYRVRERFTLAVKSNEHGLARYLARQLKEPSDQEFVKDYYEAHQKPAALLERLLKHKLRKYDSELIYHALHRLSSAEPEKAMTLLNQVAYKRKLNKKKIVALKNRIVLYAAIGQHTKATEWGRSIPVAQRTKSVRDWIARYYLRQQDWAGLLRAISVMSTEEKQSNVWLYWKARSEQELGNKSQAAKIFEKLSTQRNYYGFLAATTLGKPLEVNDQSTPPVAVSVEMPLFERVIELREVGMEHWARLEWQSLHSKLSPKEREQAVWLAHESGWHDLVFITAAANNHENHLELRFPLSRKRELEMALKSRPLDPAWVMALMRRESAFRPNVRSPQGATGLMQIMPGTGRDLARDLNMTDYQFSDLSVPERNITLGTLYLDQLRERFNGSMVLATAAYNAGPRNVVRWLPEEVALPVDVWIDTLTYRETRDYVQAVFAYAVIYQWRMHGKTDALFQANDQIVAPLVPLPVVQAKK